MQLSWLRIMYEGRVEIATCVLEIVVLSTVVLGGMYSIYHILTNKRK